MNQLGHDERIDWKPLFEPVSFHPQNWRSIILIPIEARSRVKWDQKEKEISKIPSQKQDQLIILNFISDFKYFCPGNGPYKTMIGCDLI